FRLVTVNEAGTARLSRDSTSSKIRFRVARPCRRFWVPRVFKARRREPTMMSLLREREKGCRQTTWWFRAGQLGIQPTLGNAGERGTGDGGPCMGLPIESAELIQLKEMVKKGSMALVPGRGVEGSGNEVVDG